MNTFNANVSIINKFCDNFKKTFSKNQFQAFQSIVYGLILEYKRANISAITKALNTDYQKLQYFLSEADWDYDKLNARRIQVLKNQRTTGFAKNGLQYFESGCFPIFPFVTRCFSLKWAHFGHK